MDGEAEQDDETKEKERGSGKNQDISRYREIVVPFLSPSSLPPSLSFPPTLSPDHHLPVHTLITLIQSVSLNICLSPWLVADNAYRCDPRVKRFKEQEKAEKEAKKKAKREAARQEALERERVSICFGKGILLLVF